MKHTLPTLSLCGLTLIFLAGCGKPNTTTTSNESAETINPLISLILNDAPTDPVPVAQARGEITPGTEVTLIGQVGGSSRPFNANYASFVLTDQDVMFCDEMGDAGHCPTPWDACCEDIDKLKASRASIQVVNNDGRPLPQTLKGVGGIQELDTLIVEGVIAEGSSTDNLIVNATGIYKQPG